MTDWRYGTGCMLCRKEGPTSAISVRDESGYMVGVVCASHTIADLVFGYHETRAFGGDLMLQPSVTLTSEADFLDEIIDDREAADPGFRDLVDAAAAARAKR